MSWGMGPKNGTEKWRSVLEKNELGGSQDRKQKEELGGKNQNMEPKNGEVCWNPQLLYYLS